MPGVEYFISGIDTDCGKTYITGLLAYHLSKHVHTCTTKLIQTGCVGMSEDILEHRKIMEVAPLPDDKELNTCPYNLSFPASPHLAAKIDNIQVDIHKIRQCFNQVNNNYQVVLSEGAGGLLVPIRIDYAILDYIKEYKLPLILVSSNKLGSINHTIQSLEICRNNAIDLTAFIYNTLPGTDPKITVGSDEYFRDYIRLNFPYTKYICSDELAKSQTPDLSFVLNYC